MLKKKRERIGRKRDRFSVALYATEERSPKMKNSTQNTLPHFNFSVTAELNNVTSRLIILINEEVNEANCMVRNSAKLDRRTKQHTQFGVSTSDGSKDMARTKSWRKKKKEKRKMNAGKNHIASPTGIANECWQGSENRNNVKMIKRLARRSQKALSEFKSIELTEQNIRFKRTWETDAKRKRKKRSQHKGEDDNRRKKMAFGKRLKRISNTNVQHAITLLSKFQGK